MPENVQNGLVEGDSSIVLINKGGKAEFVGSLPPSGGCIGLSVSVISHPCAGWSDSEPVGNFWGSLGIQSWGGRLSHHGSPYSFSSLSTRCYARLC